MIERGRLLRLGFAGVVLISAGIFEVRQRESVHNTAHTVSSSEQSNPALLRFQNLQIEQGELRARATWACNSLPDEIVNQIVTEATGLNGMQGFVEFQNSVTRYPTDETRAQLIRDQRKILIGCLLERNLPRDREIAVRISRIGVE